LPALQVKDLCLRAAHSFRELDEVISDREFVIEQFEHYIRGAKT
jgi:hypothetical protein